MRTMRSTAIRSGWSSSNAAATAPRPRVAVVGIVRRSGKTYVGVASLTNTSIFVTPDSKRIAVDIHLSKKLYSDVRDGDKVAVRIVSWDEGTRLPEGEIVDILGPAGDNDTEMHAILAEYDLPYRFDEEVAAAPRPCAAR